MSRLAPRFTYANVMATIAVLLSLSGTAWAATKITGSQIRDNSITARDIKNRSLGLVDLKPGVVAEMNDWASELPGGFGWGWLGGWEYDLSGGPAEPTEEQKQKNYPANVAPLAKGGSVSGVWGGKGTPNDGALWPVQLPAVPIEAIPAERVVFGGAHAAVAGDANATYCKGTYIQPTAPRGWLCIYVEPTSIAGVQALSARPVTTTKLVYPGPTEAPDRTTGFIVDVTAANGANSVVAHGSWAYTDNCSGCSF